MRFRTLAIGFGLAAAALVLIFRFAEWRAEAVSLKRFCDEPAAHVARVGRILAERDPAGGASRRPYIIAAKLLYLVPRRDGELVEAYLARLEARLVAACG